MIRTDIWKYLFTDESKPLIMMSLYSIIKINKLPSPSSNNKSFDETNEIWRRFSLLIEDDDDEEEEQQQQENRVIWSFPDEIQKKKKNIERTKRVDLLKFT